MKKELITRLKNEFEEASYEEEGIEYWSARELQQLLGYSDWRNFLNVIDKAKEACKNSQIEPNYHFVDVNKMIKLPKNATRDVEDIILTRYACYLIAQNGDPRKEEIAFAQSYFALQTRKQELLEERIELIERISAREKLIATETELSKIIYERGVDNEGFGRIRSRGDQALFGGFTTMQMKKKLNLPSNRPLADFLPTITIKAKDLATEITNFNVKKNELFGEPQITSEHIKNNQDVRNLLAKSKIKPEELPPETDIKKLQRKFKSDDKKILSDAKKLKGKDKEE
jgi:DNA-damage-inducible protein D